MFADTGKELSREKRKRWRKTAWRKGKRKLLSSGIKTIKKRASHSWNREMKKGGKSILWKKNSRGKGSLQWKGEGNNSLIVQSIVPKRGVAVQHNGKGKYWKKNLNTERRAEGGERFQVARKGKGRGGKKGKGRIALEGNSIGGKLP